MKRVIYSLCLVAFGLLMSVTVEAKTSFMDLWCEYGGEGCDQAPVQKKPAPPPAPAPVVVKPPVQAAPQVVQPAPKPYSSQPLIKRNASVTKLKGLILGRYYALVIGNNKYPNFTNLKSAVGDADALSGLLKKSYGFSVTTLTNVTRDQIIRALDEYRKILKAEDNLLIYYAGHGWVDEESERGYWLPVDADKDSRSRWVSNADITDTLKALKAKHVMVVADSCYSGTLTRSVDGVGGTRGLKLVERPSGYLETLVSRKSRTVLSSGGLEPVSDLGGGKHSVFAYALMKSLQDNTAMMDGTELFGQVRKQVLLNARQTPQYSNIRFAGHDVGGDFVFLRTDR